MPQQYGAEHGRHRDHDGGQEQTVAQFARRALPLGIAALGVTPHRQLTGPGQQGDQDHQYPYYPVGDLVAELADQQVAEQEDGAETEPEQGRRIAFGVMPVREGHADLQHDDETDEVVDIVESDQAVHHARSSTACSGALACSPACQAATSRAMLASSLSRRPMWISSAHRAVGMPHNPM